MKRTLIALALCAAGFAITGYAAETGLETPAQALQDISIHGGVAPPFATEARPLGDCTPPSDLPSCEDLHKALRASFTSRELGMLFGAASSYPEYLTSYNSVRERYGRFLNEYETVADYRPVAMAGK